MKINKININGFRNIKNTTIEFDQSNFKALVALNNYGKSNLLKSLEFAEDFIKLPSENKSRMMKYPGGVPINLTLDKSNFEFEVDFETSFEKKNFIVNYMFSFSWIKNSKDEGEKISEEYLKIKEVGKNSRYTTYVSRNKAGANYLSSRSGRCDTSIKIGNNDLIINKLKYFDDLFYHKIIEEIHQLSFNITTLLDVDNAFIMQLLSEPEVKSNNFDLDDGRNISHYLYYLKKEESAQYELLVNSLKDLIPTIEYIDVVEIDFKEQTSKIDSKNLPFTLPEKVYDIRIKEKFNNQETSIQYVSCGTKRIILILASAIRALVNNINLLAFEELENSIHPSLLQKLLIMLTSILPECRIITTSHSPYLIQYLDLGDIYLGIPNHKGIAHFDKVKKTKQKQLLNRAQDEGTNLGDYLFNLMIEGISREEIFNEYVETSI